MKGHRRVANDLLDLHHPGERAWTALEFLLIFDGSETRGEAVSISSWARAAGRSRRWVRSRIAEYREAEPELRKPRGQLAATSRPLEGQAKPSKSKGLLDSADSSRPLGGHFADTPLSSYRKQETRDKSRRGKTPPPDTLSTDELVALRGWCDQKHPDQLHHLDGLVEACLDHFRAKGELRASWLATIRGWVRRDAEWKKERSNATSEKFDPRNNPVDAGIAILREYQNRGR